ncbi:MAG: hypothetical protein H7A36_02810 [Chlamydiales bacterium]|nr:hypothetical protein [Chlamydiales bacterium]
MAAYDQESDSVLMLDISRYKYGPFWVKMDDLYASMQPHDRATDRPHGYLVVSS